MKNIGTGWFIPTSSTCPPRWVLLVGNGHVLYSNGQRKRECKVETFIRWCRRTSPRRASKR